MNYFAFRSHRPSRILVLQGPVGGFFGYLARTAQAAGSEVINVQFNLADRVFQAGGENIVCRARPDQVENWLERLCTDRRPDVILMFGDRRPVHRAACAVAERLGIAVYTFEEGYLRPNYVTFERHGNNARSQVPRTRAALALDIGSGLPARAAAPVQVGSTFTRMSLSAIAYFMALALGRPLYPQYRHHRTRTLLGEAVCWTRNAIRKITSIRRDTLIEKAVTRDLRGKYFIAALQVHDDMQLLHHGNGWTQEKLIEASIAAFAARAPTDAALIVRCHPYDRGHRSYDTLVRTVAAAHGVTQRVYLMQTGHGPTLLASAAGLITINSTMAMSAFYHGCPVYALGQSIYKVDGLVAPGDGVQGLAAFFAQPGTVNRALFERLTAALKQKALINGCFYHKRHWPIMTRQIFARLEADGIPVRAAVALENAWVGEELAAARAGQPGIGRYRLRKAG
jgi:capsular polysaccharide export protein